MYSTYLRLGLHVADSDRQVVAATRRKIKKSVRHDPSFRATRHDIYRVMLKHHKQARDLYRDVMYGEISE